MCTRRVRPKRGPYRAHLRPDTRNPQQTWRRAIDELTAMAMRGTLPDCCAWILHTTVAWLYTRHPARRGRRRRRTMDRIVERSSSTDPERRRTKSLDPTKPHYPHGNSTERQPESPSPPQRATAAQIAHPTLSGPWPRRRRR